jgi:hypothetical protein
MKIEDFQGVRRQGGREGKFNYFRKMWDELRKLGITIMDFMLQEGAES